MQHIDFKDKKVNYMAIVGCSLDVVYVVCPNKPLIQTLRIKNGWKITIRYLCQGNFSLKSIHLLTEIHV